MEFRLFGQVELHAAGHSLDVGTPRQQLVLVALAVDAGSPVAVETLVDRVWDDNPPAEARNVLYSHLSRIRQLLAQASDLAGEPAVLVRRQHAGYLLDIAPELVDVHRFCHLVEHGRACADADRVRALAEAFELWRATPLAALRGQWAARVRDRWHRYRLDAAVLWAEAQLRLGQPDPVINLLHELVTEYPFAEPLEQLLMRALHAAGRGVEAINRFDTVRQRLDAELGVTPGAELRALHQAMLRDELPPPPQADEPAAKLVRSPAQLPPDLHSFAGREDELRRLDDLAASSGSRAALAVVLSGTAGVGKTALAVHWAHRVRERFPDGQLYVNLRGFDPGEPPVAPGEAVRRLLDAFEVPPQRIPHDVDTQIGLYRSLLADKRVLVVLDNARDAEQVRPLLPGTPGCLAIVTSRKRQTGLIAGGAHPLPLDLMPVGEAREVLARRLGPDRVSAEPWAVNEIVTSCARLPLALAVVAARAANHPTFTLTSLASELRASRGSLDTFAGTDPVTDARAVFSWSYHQLGEAAARLFRLLGSHLGSDIAAPAVASLAGLTPSEVRPPLVELSEAHLLTEHRPSRYTFHELLRSYAAEQTRATDPADQRQAAIRRSLDHYLHTAHTAARLLQPARDPLVLTPPAPNVEPERLADNGEALTWFTAERAVLLAVIEHTVRTGQDDYTWQLAYTVTDFLEWRGHWTDGVGVLSAALAAAQRLGDPRKQACAHRLIAGPYLQLSRHADAHTHLGHALSLYRRCDDRTGQADTLTTLAFVLDRQGQLTAALQHTEQALELYRAVGHEHGQAKSLNNLGWSHAQLGDHQRTLVLCQQALGQYQRLGDRPGQALTWDSLGYAHQHLGNHPEALACYRRALELARDVGMFRQEISTLNHLGEAHAEAGDLESAIVAWQQSLAILDQLNHADADRIRARIRQLNRTASAG